LIRAFKYCYADGFHGASFQALRVSSAQVTFERFLLLFIKPDHTVWTRFSAQRTSITFSFFNENGCTLFGNFDRFRRASVHALRICTLVANVGDRSSLKRITIDPESGHVWKDLRCFDEGTDRLARPTPRADTGIHHKAPSSAVIQK
jgi:hypothetical protein